MATIPHLADRQRDFGDILDLVVGPCRSCSIHSAHGLSRGSRPACVFGDAPPLTPVETFYQRLLAGDASEIADQAERFLKTNSLINYYDEVALQALLMAQSDLRRGVLDEPQQRQIKETIEEVLEDLSDHVDRPPEPTPSPETAEPIAALKAADSPSPGPALAPSAEMAQPHTPAPGSESRTSVLCVAGRSFLDEAAAALFAQILEKHGIAAKVEPAGALTIGRISRLSAEAARIVCLSYLHADVSRASARFAVRRLRRRLPEPRSSLASGRPILDKRARSAPRRRRISARRGLGTHLIFVSQSPKNSRMKRRRLRSRLPPEREAVRTAGQDRQDGSFGDLGGGKVVLEISMSLDGFMAG
jgi:hypothetical protein